VIFTSRATENVIDASGNITAVAVSGTRDILIKGGRKR